MSEPLGNLVTVVAFRADGSLHALELSNTDELKVSLASLPTADEHVYGWDGANWQKLAVDASGRLTLFQQTPNNLQTGVNGYDGANWQKLAVDSSGRLTLFQQTPANLLTGDGVYDGTNWQKLKGFSDGVLYAANMPHRVYDASGVTQILANTVHANSEATAYTTPAGKTGYIDSIFFTAANNTAAQNNTIIRVYNAVPAVVANYYLIAAVAGLENANVVFPIPLVLEAGWSIRSFSPAAGFTSSLTVHGIQV